MSTDFTKVMSERTDEELLKIITIERENYQPLAVKSAEEEFKNRNVDLTQIKEAQNYLNAQNKKRNLSEEELEKQEHHSLDFKILEKSLAINYINNLGMPLVEFLYDDDEKLILDDSCKFGLIGILMPLIIPLLFFNIFFIILYIMEQKGVISGSFSVLHLLIFTGIVLPAIFSTAILEAVVEYKISPKNIFVFNRKKGTVTYPTFRGNKTVPFANLHPKARLWWSRAGKGGWYLVILNHRFWEVKIGVFHKGEQVFSLWSSIVWFMDKNRTYPAGDLFDPYRKLDYNRRKAEGFPPPLYSSETKLPEWRVYGETDRQINKKEKTE